MVSICNLPKSVPITFILAFLLNYGLAQKLKNVQTESFKAPALVKIDGLNKEWGNRFQAYNNAIGAYYTIANDEKNIYMVIQAADPNIIIKMIQNGTTLTLGNAGKHEFSVTFPFYESKNVSAFFMLKNKPEKIKDTIRYQVQIDSFKRVLNAELSKAFKSIGISQGSAVPDSSLSVYNEEGIKAMGAFDNNLCFTIELAVPVKYLPAEEKKGLKYKITINGLAAKNQTLEVTPSGRFYYIRDLNGKPVSATPVLPQTSAMAYPTYVIGEYVLIKKP